MWFQVINQPVNFLIKYRTRAPCLLIILKSRHLINTGKLLALLFFFLLLHCTVYGCLICDAGLETFCWFFTREIKEKQDWISCSGLGEKGVSCSPCWKQPGLCISRGVVLTRKCIHSYLFVPKIIPTFSVWQLILVITVWHSKHFMRKIISLSWCVSWSISIWKSPLPESWE